MTHDERKTLYDKSKNYREINNKIDSIAKNSPNIKNNIEKEVDDNFKKNSTTQDHALLYGGYAKEVHDLLEFLFEQTGGPSYRILAGDGEQVENNCIKDKIITFSKTYKDKIDKVGDNRFMLSNSYIKDIKNMKYLISIGTDLADYYLVFHQYEIGYALDVKKKEFEKLFNNGNSKSGKPISNLNYNFSLDTIIAKIDNLRKQKGGIKSLDPKDNHPKGYNSFDFNPYDLDRNIRKNNDLKLNQVTMHLAPEYYKVYNQRKEIYYKDQHENKQRKYLENILNEYYKKYFYFDDEKVNEDSINKLIQDYPKTNFSKVNQRDIIATLINPDYYVDPYYYDSKLKNSNYNKLSDSSKGLLFTKMNQVYGLREKTHKERVDLFFEKVKEENHKINEYNYKLLKLNPDYYTRETFLNSKEMKNVYAHENDFKRGITYLVKNNPIEYNQNIINEFYKNNNPIEYNQNNINNLYKNNNPIEYNQNTINNLYKNINFKETNQNYYREKYNEIQPVIQSIRTSMNKKTYELLSPPMLDAEEKRIKNLEDHLEKSKGYETSYIQQHAQSDSKQYTNLSNLSQLVQNSNNSLKKYKYKNDGYSKNMQIKNKDLKDLIGKKKDMLKELKNINNPY